MKIDASFKKKINNCVVRIVAEVMNINWNIPYMLERPLKGQGSGFFIDNKGHILTCAHVVNGAKNIYIEIPNISSDKYECTIVGICPFFDIALIKCKNYKSKDYLEIGDSLKINIGKEVIVVGYPASYTLTSSNKNNLKFTVGIISGQQKGLIQTDSAINPGNSGGPLICKNKVIGINSMKLVGDSLENIGYAVPINNYKMIKDSFQTNIIYRPNLLFEFNNTDKLVLQKLTNNKCSNGIIVSKIFNHSPLLETYIKKDSIITKINDVEIDNYGLSLNYKWLETNISIDVLLNNFKNNDTLKINYFNNDKHGIANVKLTPFIPPVRSMYPSIEDIPYFIIGAVVFMDLNINHIKNNSTSFLSILSDTEELLKPHLIVSFVFPNSKIDILNNITKDNLITKVNNIDVCCLNDFKKALNKLIIINNKEYIKIESDKGRSIIMLVEDLIGQDILFSNQYGYSLSDFHKKYIK